MIYDMGDLTFWIGVIFAVPGLLWNHWPTLVLAVMWWVFLGFATMRRHKETDGKRVYKG